MLKPMEIETKTWWWEFRGRVFFKFCNRRMELQKWCTERKSIDLKPALQENRVENKMDLNWSESKWSKGIVSWNLWWVYVHVFTSWIVIFLILYWRQKHSITIMLDNYFIHSHLRSNLLLSLLLSVENSLVSLKI